jgi:hypothetical protein
MVVLGVSFGPRTPEMLIEEVVRLPSMVRELELSTAHCVVHQILAMIESQYQGLNCTTLSGSWAPGIPMTIATSWNRTAPPLLARRPTPP